MFDNRVLRVSFEGAKASSLIEPGIPAYQGYIDYAGGLEPGQTKPLRPREAVVEMAADRSLRIAWLSAGPEGGVEKLNPASPRYDEIVSRLGGLQAGQSKILFPAGC